MAMHHLQISLPEWQYRFLQEQASRTGQSIAALIRELIEQEAQAVQRPVEEDPIWEVVGIGRGGPPYDVSERVDEFLYGVQGKIDVEERRRRAIAAAGRFHSGAPDISTKHNEYLGYITANLED
jgi:hypothetical protein